MLSRGAWPSSAEANCTDRLRLRELICHRNRLLSGAAAPPRPASTEASRNRQWHATAAAAASSTCCGGGFSADVLRGETTTPARNTIRQPYTSGCHTISASVAAVASTARKH